MSAEYSVEEVRDAARQLVGPMGRMLHNYANLLERIEADDRVVPIMNVRCEVQTENGISGSTYLNVVRVEAENDGSFTAVTDQWPNPPAQAPIIVPPYVSADDANRLYGETFGVDWKYEAAPAQAAQVDRSDALERAEEDAELEGTAEPVAQPHSPDAAK